MIIDKCKRLKTAENDLMEVEFDQKSASRLSIPLSLKLYNFSEYEIECSFVNCINNECAAELRACQA